MKFLRIAFIIFLISMSSAADSITHGGTSVDMELVNIGFSENIPDSTGYGAVDYNYRIGKYEVTIEQFEAAYSADNRIGNGNENYWNDGIRTVGATGPVSYVSAYEAMKFANWLTTGDAHTGAYNFDNGGTLIGVDRNAAVTSYGIVYVLPTEDEWYKAAYYKPVNDGSYSLYASGLDSAPTLGTSDGWNYYFTLGSPGTTWEAGFGAAEQNGTHDMMGNLAELTESALDGTLDNMYEARAVRGGHAIDYDGWLSSSNRKTGGAEFLYDSFRIAAIPEPTTTSLIGLGVLVSLLTKFWKKPINRPATKH